MIRLAALRSVVALLVALALVVAGASGVSAAREEARLSAFDAAKAVLTTPERAAKPAGAPCAGADSGLPPEQDAASPRMPCARIARLPDPAWPESARRTILKEARAPPRKTG